MMIGNDYFDDRVLCLITPRIGTANSEEKGIYHLFPNPTQRFSKFYYKNIEENSTELTVSDVLGEIVDSYKLNSTEGTILIDTKGLSAGIYYLLLRNSYHILNVSLLIKIK